MSNSRPHVTASDEVERSLLRHISKSGLAPGDSLPSENRLSELLTVGRPTIREGISRLRAYGMVRGNRRGGNILCEPQVFASLNVLMSYHLIPGSILRGMMAMRIVIELGSSEFVFRNATNADFRELRQLAAESEPLPDCDIRFHRRLFSIGNCLIQKEFGDLLNAVFSADGYEFNGAAPALEPGVTHLDLCEELEHGTAAGFHLALRRHLQPYDYLFAPEGTTPRPPSPHP